MGAADLPQLLEGLSQDNLPVRLSFNRRGALDRVLAAQAVDLREQLNVGIDGYVTCVSTRDDLPPQSLLGMPVTVEIVTARGTLRRMPLLVRQMLRGQSDGALTLYQLQVCDAFRLLDKRIGSRVFRNSSVVDITRIVLDQVRRQAPALGAAFDYLLELDEPRYPKREFTLQANESVRGFLTRHWKKHGINFFIRPSSSDNGPAQELVLFDDPSRLKGNVAGALRYHRLDGTEEADSIVLWAEAARVGCGEAVRHSWDYKHHRSDLSRVPTLLDQGEANELVAYLRDVRIELPHAGDDLADFERQTRLRMERHEFEAGCVYGVSGCRDMAVGEFNAVQGHPLLDMLSPEQREYVFIEVHHRAENNRKEIGPRVAKLLQRCERLPGWRRMGMDELAAAEDPSDARHRYLNRFAAVRKGVPLRPAFDPALDLPPVKTLTAIVVGPMGEEVHTDEHGRVKVQIVGLDPADHEHAEGAGTSGTDRDSAWVRFDSLWAGPDYGVFFPLRAGMEVSLSFEHGDPDRPVISRVHYTGAHRPPRFSHAGPVPGNRYLSGIKTKEVKGKRYGQLVFDDTTGQISVVLDSEHGHSRLMLGELRLPRHDGKAEPVGEGFYLHTDESGAIRTAKSLLITAYARLGHAGVQLDAQEHLQLVDDCYQLFTRLGEYASQHHGAQPDPKAMAELQADLKAAQGGSNTDPKGQGGAPTISLSAPAGIAATTPKGIVHYAGTDVDTVAMQHLSLTAGQALHAMAGQGVRVFAHQQGVQAIAHHGPMHLQSQHDDTRIESGKNVTIAAQESITLMADKIHLVANGSAITLEKLLTLMSEGAIASKGSAFPHDGPQSMSAQLPRFAEVPVDQRFVLRAGDGEDAVPLGDQPYRITLSDGQVIEGVTDAEGHTQLLQRTAMQIAEVTLIKKPKT